MALLVACVCVSPCERQCDPRVCACEGGCAPRGPAQPPCACARLCLRTARRKGWGRRPRRCGRREPGTWPGRWAAAAAGAPSPRRRRPGWQVGGHTPGDGGARLTAEPADPVGLERRACPARSPVWGVGVGWWWRWQRQRAPGCCPSRFRNPFPVAALRLSSRARPGLAGSTTLPPTPAPRGEPHLRCPGRRRGATLLKDQRTPLPQELPLRRPLL